MSSRYWIFQRKGVFYYEGACTHSPPPPVASGTAAPPRSGQPSLHPQPTLAPDALHQLLAGLPPFGHEQPCELAVAQAWIFPRQSLDLLPQSQQPVGWSLVLVTAAGPMQVQIPTCPPLRTQSQGHHSLDRPALVQRAHHFFAFTSSSTRILSIASATSFFSSVFSLSSSR
jgi:hypothetical protein